MRSLGILSCFNNMSMFVCYPLVIIKGSVSHPSKNISYSLNIQKNLERGKNFKLSC